MQICTAGTVYPLSLGAEFIRDLRIKAPDLSVFVRKSALQVHTLYPLYIGAGFIRDLRIKALDLPVFLRKSALQVHCTRYPWGQSSYET